MADWIQDGQQEFAASDRRNMRFVTVMLDPVADVGQIKPAIDRGKVTWRNLIYRLRKADERANDLRIIGVAEVDWYHASHVHRLSGYKRTQLDSLGFDVTEENVWMPHFHLIVDVAGFPARKFEEAVLRQWPGARQVNIKPLDDLYTVERNIERILSYSTKHKRFYKIDPYGEPKLVPWSEKATASYFNMLFEAGGFSLLRFHLKPRAKKNKVIEAHQRHKRTIREPMPLIIW